MKRRGFLKRMMAVLGSSACVDFTKAEPVEQQPIKKDCETCRVIDGKVGMGYPNPCERLHITSTGNVGIGTSPPPFGLNVCGDKA